MCGSRPEERWMEHEGTYQWRAFFVDVSSITLRGAVIEGVCVQKHVKPPTNCVICRLCFAFKAFLMKEMSLCF